MRPTNASSHAPAASTNQGNTQSGTARLRSTSAAAKHASAKPKSIHTAKPHTAAYPQLASSLPSDTYGSGYAPFDRSLSIKSITASSVSSVRMDALSASLSLLDMELSGDAGFSKPPPPPMRSYRPAMQSPPLSQPGTERVSRGCDASCQTMVDDYVSLVQSEELDAFDVELLRREYEEEVAREDEYDNDPEMAKITWNLGDAATKHRPNGPDAEKMALDPRDVPNELDADGNDGISGSDDERPSTPIQFTAVPPANAIRPKPRRIYSSAHMMEMLLSTPSSDRPSESGSESSIHGYSTSPDSTKLASVISDGHRSAFTATNYLFMSPGSHLKGKQAAAFYNQRYFHLGRTTNL